MRSLLLTCSPAYAAELRVPPQPALALFIVPGLALALAGWALPNPQTAFAMAVALYLTAGLIFALDAWQREAGCWATGVALSLFILAAAHWLQAPAALALLPLPVLLAGAMLGPATSLLLAVVQAAAFASFLWAFPGEMGLAGLAFACGASGLTAVAVCWLYRPIYDLAQYSCRRYEQAESLLDDARDRQAELKDALAALAHANRELALANERLAAMRLVAEEARKSKAAFVANVSHELRTPLNIIIGLADLLLRPPELGGPELPPAVQEDLTILYRNCEHLAGMINDVLDLSQVEAGRITLRREWVDLRELAEGALKIVHPLLAKKSLWLHLSLPPELPRVYCDPRRIRQVILNLLSNAARYTERGGITLEAAVEGRQIRVAVADTGPGIAPGDADRIFEPFQQSPTVHAQVRGTSGLGLSISKQFVEMHEGHIGVETTPGGGSTFYFGLPITPPAGPVAPPQRWITEHWSERTVHAHVPTPHLDQRLILCDPTGEIQPLLARLAEDIEFIQARTPGEAAHALQQRAAGAILVNAPLPEGLWGLVDEVRIACPETPVLGCSIPAPRERATLAGADGLLLKPLLRLDLEAAIARLDQPVERALVVDDDPDALHTLSEMLSAMGPGIEVITASDGQGALEKLRSERPDLLLLDAVMPRLDGWQVLAAKMADERLRPIPTFLITARDPRDEPLASRVLLATAGAGLSLNKLLRCAQMLTDLLLQPD